MCCSGSLGSSCCELSSCVLRVPAFSTGSHFDIQSFYKISVQLIVPILWRTLPPCDSRSPPSAPLAHSFSPLLLMAKPPLPRRRPPSRSPARPLLPPPSP